jgi:hypothetical protein
MPRRILACHNPSIILRTEMKRKFIPVGKEFAMKKNTNITGISMSKGLERK